MRDPKTENFLNAGGYKWKYLERVDFSEIDIKASQENPARLYRTVNEATAESYMLAMAAGDEFPAIVLLTLDNQTSVLPYLIATGVHRTYAAQLCDRTCFDAYVVAEADNLRRVSLIRRLNIIEGYGVTVKDRIAQALQMQADYPELTWSALAKDWNVNLETLKMAGATQKAVDRGRRFGYTLDDGKLKLTQKSILSLNKIHSDRVFDKAAHFAVVNGATTNDITDLCKEINKTRDEAAALALVDRAEMVQAEKRMAAKARHGRVPPHAATQFFGDLRRIINQAAKGIDRLHLVAFPDRKTGRSLTEQISNLMHLIRVEFDRIDRVETPSPGPSATDLVH